MSSRRNYPRWPEPEKADAMAISLGRTAFLKSWEIQPGVVASASLSSDGL
jgi:hypothetical protein